MRIGLLSICAMMFLLYGTDCRADRNVKDFEVSGASQVVDGEGFTPVSDMNRKTRKRARFINKKQSDAAENNKNPWFRDKRSFADVVKGVKKGEDDNKTVVVKGVKKEEDDNKTVVGDYDYQKNIDGFANVAEGVKKDNESHQVKKAHHAEMTKEQRAARSKKAFEARRSREKQRRKFTDEVRKN